MPMMTTKELTAIIKMLDDPDTHIFNELKNMLISEGPHVVQFLEKSWENSNNEIIQSRIEEIIQIIQFDNIKKELKKWKDEGQNNLLFGAYLISKFQYPELDLSEIESKIENIKKEVWIELNNNLTALEKIKIINHIFYKILGFKRNVSNPYSPQNLFINDLLELKKGNQISLSILYAIISQELGLPVYGVNLPGSIILAYKDEISLIEDFEFKSEHDILFYINPFNKGAVFGKREIDYYLKQQNIEPQKDFYQPCSNVKTLERMITSLIECFEKLGYKEKIVQLNILRKIIG